MKFGKSVSRHFNFTLPRRINGRWIKLPVVGGFKVGIRGELFLLDILNFLLPKLDGAVVDVGANVGQTLAKVKLAKSDQTYYGIEPNPACFAYLEKLVEANGWTDVSFFCCGLSDRTSILSLHVSSEKSTDSQGSFRPDDRPELNANRVKHSAVFSFADIDPLIHERIALLKIDVEGAELEVVCGATDAVRRDRPVITIEMMPIPSLEDRHKQTVALLQSIDYRVFSINKSADRHWTGLQSIEDFTCPMDSSMSDYLAVPADQQDLLAGIFISPTAK